MASNPPNEKKSRKKRKKKLTGNSNDSNETHETSESDMESHSEPKKPTRSSSPSPSAKKNPSQSFCGNFSSTPDSPKLYEERDNSAIEQIEPSRILEQSMATAEVTGQDNGDELISFGSPNGKGFEEEGMENSLFDENPLISVTESNTSDAMLLTTASTSAAQGKFCL